MEGAEGGAGTLELLLPFWAWEMFMVSPQHQSWTRSGASAAQVAVRPAVMRSKAEQPCQEACVTSSRRTVRTIRVQLVACPV